MKKPNAKAVIIALLTFLKAIQGHSTIYYDYGSANPYWLHAGDVLEIVSGIYRGSIKRFDAHATIKVSTDAQFRPFEINEPKGKIINSGVSFLAFDFLSEDDFILDNFGRFTIAGTVSTKGNQFWRNRFGGHLTLTGRAEFNAGAKFENEGRSTAEGDFFLNSNSLFRNDHTVNINGNLSFNGGSTMNKGVIHSKGFIHYNAGTDHTTSCRLISDKEIINNHSLVNDGFIWVKNHQGTKGKFINAGFGALELKPNSLIKSDDFTNYSTIIGRGSLFFDHDTWNSGIIGSGIQGEMIQVYDATRTDPSKVFDVDWGIVRNARYEIMPPPDVNQMPAGCSDLLVGGVLPVTWVYFHAKQEHKKIKLSWKTGLTNALKYTVEKSNGKNSYTPIASVVASSSNNVHTYEDTEISGTASYYRIKAELTNGRIEYSEVNAVYGKEAGNQSLTAMPNPANKQITFSFEHQEIAEVSIIVHSINGQQVLMKKVQAVIGRNNITLHEVANFNSGVYIVEIKTSKERLGHLQFIKK